MNSESDKEALLLAAEKLARQHLEEVTKANKQRLKQTVSIIITILGLTSAVMLKYFTDIGNIKTDVAVHASEIANLSQEQNATNSDIAALKTSVDALLFHFGIDPTKKPLQMSNLKP